MAEPTESQALPELLLTQPAFLMMQILRAGKQRAEASPEGPRLPFLMVLASLDEFGPHSQRDLCQRLSFDPSDMVGWIDRLEALGFARRGADPADRRRHAVEITDSGREWLAGATERMGERAALLRGLEPAEREELVDLLQRVLGPLRDAPAPTPPAAG